MSTVPPQSAFNQPAFAGFQPGQNSFFGPQGSKAPTGAAAAQGGGFFPQQGFPQQQQGFPQQRQGFPQQQTAPQAAAPPSTRKAQRLIDAGRLAPRNDGSNLLRFTPQVMVSNGAGGYKGPVSTNPNRAPITTAFDSNAAIEVARQIQGTGACGDVNSTTLANNVRDFVNSVRLVQFNGYDAYSALRTAALTLGLPHVTRSNAVWANGAVTPTVETNNKRNAAIRSFLFKVIAEHCNSLPQLTATFQQIASGQFVRALQPVPAGAYDNSPRIETQEFVDIFNSIRSPSCNINRGDLARLLDDIDSINGNRSKINPQDLEAIVRAFSQGVGGPVISPSKYRWSGGVFAPDTQPRQYKNGRTSKLAAGASKKKVKASLVWLLATTYCADLGNFINFLESITGTQGFQQNYSNKRVTQASTRRNTNQASQQVPLQQQQNPAFSQQAPRNG